MIDCNEALWVDVECHMTSFNQLEWFRLHYLATLVIIKSYLNVAVHVKVFASVAQAAVLHQGRAPENGLKE